jgi:preprotein translocase subunit SecB
MSDTKSMPAFKLNGLYVKDLSFENPGAPGVFLQPTGKPRINVSVDVFVNNLKDTAYEVALKASAKATAEDGKGMFIVEVVYAGLFVLNPELPREAYEKILFVDCAQVVFPFVRRLIVDLSTEGGFPPVLLEPINLEAIFNAKKQAKPAA